MIREQLEWTAWDAEVLAARAQWLADHLEAGGLVYYPAHERIREALKNCQRAVAVLDARLEKEKAA